MEKKNESGQQGGDFSLWMILKTNCNEKIIKTLMDLDFI